MISFNLSQLCNITFLGSGTLDTSLNHIWTLSIVWILSLHTHTTLWRFPPCWRRKHVTFGTLYVSQVKIFKVQMGFSDVSNQLADLVAFVAVWHLPHSGIIRYNPAVLKTDCICFFFYFIVVWSIFRLLGDAISTENVTLFRRRP